jgi:hypothetical protein
MVITMNMLDRRFSSLQSVNLVLVYSWYSTLLLNLLATAIESLWARLNFYWTTTSNTASRVAIYLPLCWYKVALMLEDLLVSHRQARLGEAGVLQSPRRR